MSRFASVFIIVAVLGLTSGCSRIMGPRGPQATSPGTPEALLDVSSEVVNLGIGSGKEIDDLSQWINRDQPTRAELYCAEGEKNCREARQVLELYGVPVMAVNSGAGTVTLVYERVLARDCNQRFNDNRHLWYNENHESFGCALSANIVQHVTQKQQFISPNLSDYRDAESAISGYARYQSAVGQATTDAVGNFRLDNSLLGSAKTE